jgi:hypothetical protein
MKLDQNWHKTVPEDPDMNPHGYAHIIFLQRHPKHTMEKRRPLQQMLLGKLDFCMQKTESKFVSFTLYQYKLKVDYRP